MRHPQLIIVLFAGLFSGYCASAQTAAPQLSADARVSLITVGPGTDVYSAYGHTAIRITDPQLGLDYVFNYGTFDFRTEGFLMKFIRGRLPYMLSIHGFDVLLESAAQERRGISEQVLSLNTQQASRLFALLMENYKPENRFYPYDFFSDNCATRPRDMLDSACGSQLIWLPRGVQPQTFRQLVDPYHTPLIDLGTDLALGRPADAVADERQRMFLPNELRDAASVARLGDRPLVSQVQIQLAPPILPRPSPIEQKWPIWALTALSLILLAYAGRRAWLRGSLQRPAFRAPALLVGLLIVVGLLGVLLTFLTFFTDHRATVWNLNLLWAWPTHLVLAILLLRRRWRSQAWVRIYLWITGVASLLTGVVWLLGLQAIHPAALVLALGLGTLLVEFGVDGFDSISDQPTKPEPVS
jgi:hypothetical protein